MTGSGYIWALFVAILTSGCGPAFLPWNTTKPVTTADVSGVWEYPADYGKITVTLELKADGSFFQSVAPAGGAATQTWSGTWELDAQNWISLDLLVPDVANAAAQWKVQSVNWYVVDSYQKGVKFAVFGSADSADPDSFNEFKKISGPRAMPPGN